MTASARRLALGITGASGAIYAQALLQRLLPQPDLTLDLIVSPAGDRVWRQELDQQLALETLRQQHPAATLLWHPHDDIGAPPATGSTPCDAYLIVPCSMGTVGRIAAGVSDSLITRMADVALKERRPLLLLIREAPLSAIHLQNLLTLTQSGATVLPAAPGFYQQPRSIADLVTFMTDRLLAHLPHPRE